MVNRKSLGEALALSPDKLAFIQGSEKPANPVPEKQMIRAGTETEDKLDGGAGEHAAPLSMRDVPRTTQSLPSERRTGRRPRRETPTVDPNPIPYGTANLLAPLTTRLQPATSAALKRAVLEQRLNGRNPATVQEIVEQAVGEWLAKHTGH